VGAGRCRADRGGGTTDDQSRTDRASALGAAAFDRAAEDFSRLSPLLWDPVGAATVAVSRPGPGEFVLDACCGDDLLVEHARPAAVDRLQQLGHPETFGADALTGGPPVDATTLVGLGRRVGTPTVDNSSHMFLS
jgi:hypothetical protein